MLALTELSSSQSVVVVSAAATAVSPSTAVSPTSSSHYSSQNTQSQQFLPDEKPALIRRIGQELTCAICLNLLKEPSLTPCHHTFCRECIGRMFRVGQKTDGPCPICKTRISRRTIRPALALCELANSFKDFITIYEKELGRAWDEPSTDDDSSDNDGEEEEEGEERIFGGKENNLPNVKVWSTPNSTTSSQEIEEMERLDLQLRFELEKLDTLIEVKRKERITIMEEADTLRLAENLQFPSSPDDFLFLSPPDLLPPLPQLPIATSSLSMMMESFGQTIATTTTTIIIGTSLLSQEELDNVITFTKRANCTYKSQFTENLTHLIVPAKSLVAKRTLKFLRAILHGCWILSYDWIESCSKAGQLVDEEPFEIAGDEYYPSEQGPHRARLSTRNHENPLMFGVTFYLYGTFSSPPASDLSILIKDSGGNLIVDYKDLTLQRDDRVIILYDPKEQTQGGLKLGHPTSIVLADFGPILPFSWLLDCIGAFQIIDYNNNPCGGGSSSAPRDVADSRLPPV